MQYRPITKSTPLAPRTSRWPTMEVRVAATCRCNSFWVYCCRRTPSQALCARLTGHDFQRVLTEGVLLYWGGLRPWEQRAASLMIHEPRPGALATGTPAHAVRAPQKAWGIYRGGRHLKGILHKAYNVFSPAHPHYGGPAVSVGQWAAVLCCCSDMLALMWLPTAGGDAEPPCAAVH